MLNVVLTVGRTVPPASPTWMTLIRRSAWATYRLGLSIPTTLARPFAAVPRSTVSTISPVAGATNETPCPPATATRATGVIAKLASRPSATAAISAACCSLRKPPSTTTLVGPTEPPIAALPVAVVSRRSYVATDPPTMPARAVAAACRSVTLAGSTVSPSPTPPSARSATPLMAIWPTVAPVVGSIETT